MKQFNFMGSTVTGEPEMPKARDRRVLIVQKQMVVLGSGHHQEGATLRIASIG